MAARFGAVEIKAMLYVLLPWPLRLAFRKWALHDMEYNAGFFPLTYPPLKRFANLMLSSIESLDVLASWRIEEVYFRKRLAHTYKMSLGCMGPATCLRLTTNVESCANYRRQQRGMDFMVRGAAMDGG